MGATRAHVQPMKFVLDASTAIKYSLSSGAVSVLSSAGKLVVPVTWNVEVASGLHQGCLKKRVTEAHARAALRRLQALAVETVPVPSPIKLFDLQYRHAIAAYDAVYVAIAIERGLQIATDDLHLERNLRARNLGHLLLPAGALPAPT